MRWLLIEMRDRSKNIQEASREMTAGKWIRRCLVNEQLSLDLSLNSRVVPAYWITFRWCSDILLRWYPWASYSKQNNSSDITRHIKNGMPKEGQCLRRATANAEARRFTNCFPEFASQQFSLTLKVSQGQSAFFSPNKQPHLQQEYSALCLSRHQS